MSLWCVGGQRSRWVSFFYGYGDDGDLHCVARGQREFCMGDSGSDVDGQEGVLRGEVLTFWVDGSDVDGQEGLLLGEVLPLFIDDGAVEGQGGFLLGGVVTL